MKTLITYLLVAIFTIISNFNTIAQEKELLPLKDNTIYSEGDSSNGKGLFLFTGATNNGAKRKALIKFDLSTIPTSDSIVTANFRIQVSKTISSVQQIRLYKLSSDWGEANSDAKFEEGGGATAHSGDVTWNYSFFDSIPWEIEGGDYNSIPTDSIEIGDTGSYTWSGEGITKDVQYWFLHPEQNFGWILTIENSSASSKRINSRDNPDKPPLLIIQTISRTNSISEISNTDFNIYPNPGTGEFHITNTKLVPVENIRIFDITGKEIKTVDLEMYSKTESGIQLYIRQKGIYLVMINNVFFKKVIVL